MADEKREEKSHEKEMLPSLVQEHFLATTIDSMTLQKALNALQHILLAVRLILYESPFAVMVRLSRDPEILLSKHGSLQNMSSKPRAEPGKGFGKQLCTWIKSVFVSLSYV